MSIEGIRKEYLFREKWYIKGFGVDLGAKPSIPVQTSPPPRVSEFRNTVFPRISGHALISNLSLKGWALTTRRVLNQGGMHSLRFSLNELGSGLVVPRKFRVFTKKVGNTRTKVNRRETHIKELQAPHGYRYK